MTDSPHPMKHISLPELNWRRSFGFFDTKQNDRSVKCLAWPRSMTMRNLWRLHFSPLGSIITAPMAEVVDFLRPLRPRSWCWLKLESTTHISLQKSGFPIHNNVPLQNCLAKLRKESMGSLRSSLQCKNSQWKKRLRFWRTWMGFDDEVQTIQFVISTKRLLTNVSHVQNVHTDATYKCLWQGYPVLIVGTSDKDNKFHPICLAVCSNETAEDFMYTFKTMKLDLNPSPVFSWPPLYSLTFASPGLLLEEFQAHSQDVVQEYCGYFKKGWVDSELCHWFEGAAPGHPSANNGLESLKSLIKNNGTLRNQMPVGQFVNWALELVWNWSRERDSHTQDCKRFSVYPSITLQVQNQACKWLKQSQSFP